MNLHNVVFFLPCVDVEMMVDHCAELLRELDKEPDAIVSDYDISKCP